MNDEIEANTSLVFVHDATQLTVNFSAPINTSCSGNLCDRQRVKGWLNMKDCGCYGMSTKQYDFGDTTCNKCANCTMRQVSNG